MLGYDTTNLLNILRVAVCIIILGYSCVTDWKTRRAPNRLWYIMGAIGLVLGIYELYGSGFDRYLIYSWAFGVIFIFVIMYFLYYFFQYFGMTGLGGADAKALIAIAFLFPYYPHIELAGIYLPVSDVTRSIVFGFAVFGNALVLNLVVPVAVLVYNLVTVPFGELRANPIGSFTGYMAGIEGLKGKHVRLMHRYAEEEGRIIKKRNFGGSEVDGETYKNLLKWKTDGKIGDKAWVTPKIPFLIPITLGFLVAIVYGDILTQVISFFLWR
jgi:preflagellin peptidase FlaK